MVSEINSEIIKEYGVDAGASVVGIADSKDFELAPKGFKPTRMPFCDCFRSSISKRGHTWGFN
jgi:hypothetical protein